jgi:STE24 endopeptidase
MLHLLLIALVVTLVADDTTGASLRVPFASPGLAAIVVLAACASLAIGVVAWGWLCASRVRRSGRAVWVGRAQRAAGATRVCAVLVNAFGVLALGWLDAVRAAIGDWVLLDEVVALLPALGVFFASWLAFGPLDRLLWEGSLVRTLDDGAPLHPPRGPWRYALDQARHGGAIVLVPLAIIWSWSEGVVKVVERAGVTVDTDGEALALSAAQFIGVIVAFVVTPPLMMRIWRTVPLGAGDVRDRLEALCRRHRVRCRDIRVWMTDGMMLNGAVMGIFAPVRYILLTDALLESLPSDQVEAVAAHEIAHIRRRHLPWLLGARLVAIWIGGAVVLIPFDLIVAALGMNLLGTPADYAAQTAGAVLSIACAVLAFGIVSRAFERQADAFAAQSLSGLDTPDEPHARITPEAASSMAGALDAVARLNAIPAQRFFWRHGSIAGRRRRIRDLEGAPVRFTGADRQARRLKRAILIGLLVMASVEAMMAFWSM